jgi:hypothetical protein
MHESCSVWLPSMLRCADRNFLTRPMGLRDVHKLIITALVPFATSSQRPTSRSTTPVIASSSCITSGRSAPFGGRAGPGKFHDIAVRPHSSCATPLAANNHLSLVADIPLLENTERELQAQSGHAATRMLLYEAKHLRFS